MVPDELKLLHCEDFRDDTQHAFHLKNLVRQLREPVPPLGELIAVPSLPAHYLARADRLRTLQDALIGCLDLAVAMLQRDHEVATLAGASAERATVLFMPE